MPQAGAFIDESSWEDVGDGNGESNDRQQRWQRQHQQRTRNDGLPAGRFSDDPRQSASEAAAAAAEEPDKVAGGLPDKASIARFSLTPRAVKAHLDKYVIGQDQAKRALSVAVCDHYNFARTCLASPDLAPSHHVKPNILLLGPSGSGKTHLMRALSKLLCVPFVKADATKFSATGYVGGDVDDVVRSLLPAAGGDVESGGAVWFAAAIKARARSRSCSSVSACSSSMLRLRRRGGSQPLGSGTTTCDGDV